TSMRYFSPPIDQPPCSLISCADVSAQYRFTRPHEAAGPLITPSTPILRTFCSAFTEPLGTVNATAPAIMAGTTALSPFIGAAPPPPSPWSRLPSRQRG